MELGPADTHFLINGRRLPENVIDSNARWSGVPRAQDIIHCATDLARSALMSTSTVVGIV